MPAEVLAELVAARVAELTGKPAAGARRIGRGANSKVYRVDCRDGAVYAAKQYAQPTADGLHRGEVEFGALSLLRRCGETRVPAPVAADHATQLAVYEFVAGTGMDDVAITGADIDETTAFVARLGRVSKLAGLDWTLPASEACFSLAALECNILGRLAALEEALETAGEDGPPLAGLGDYLGSRFIPASREVFASSRGRLGTPEAASAELAPGLRILSPSDFGFHNALRAEDGRLTFVDFEYFGWDDPAKLIADFVLHPGMSLSAELKRRFSRGVLDGLSRDGGLAARLELVYPLFGLKWCMILLNPFRPGGVAATGPHPGELTRLRAERLAKAEAMLDLALGGLDFFPYK
jgi:hypothetical protein